MLWSLGPAEPPSSSVFSYSINCWISKKRWFSTENLASFSPSPTYNKWKHLSKCFWWVLTKVSGNIWWSFLKAIGKSKVCVFTQLTAFLRLGLFKIKKPHRETLLQTPNCRSNCLLLVPLSQLEEGLQWVLLDQKDLSAANKGKIWTLGIWVEASCLSAAA